MRPAIPQNKPHDYSWSIISNRHLKKGVLKRDFFKSIVQSTKYLLTCSLLCTIM